MSRRIWSKFDIQDCLIYGGIFCLAVGLALVYVPLSLIVAGGLAFLLGVGHFAPKGGTS